MYILFIHYILYTYTYILIPTYVYIYYIYNYIVLICDMYNCHVRDESIMSDSIVLTHYLHFFMGQTVSA